MRQFNIEFRSATDAELDQIKEEANKVSNKLMSNRYRAVREDLQKVREIIEADYKKLAHISLDYVTAVLAQQRRLLVVLEHDLCAIQLQRQIEAEANASRELTYEDGIAIGRQLEREGR